MLARLESVQELGLLVVCEPDLHLSLLGRGVRQQHLHRPVATLRPHRAGRHHSVRHHYGVLALLRHDLRRGGHAGTHSRGHGLRRLHRDLQRGVTTPCRTVATGATVVTRPVSLCPDSAAKIMLTVRPDWILARSISSTTTSTRACRVSTTVPAAAPLPTCSPTSNAIVATCPAAGATSVAPAGSADTTTSLS